MISWLLDNIEKNLDFREWFVVIVGELNDLIWNIDFV